jgi:hypothetical protein
MRPAPDFLPSARSRKWHSRRWWDSLGYLRVRSLARPNWPRDVDWLIGVLDSHRGGDPHSAKGGAIDEAIRSARRYRSLDRKSDPSSEAEWDAMLDAVDRYLRIVQDDHLRAVDEAGASGRS